MHGHMTSVLGPNKQITAFALRIFVPTITSLSVREIIDLHASLGRLHVDRQRARPDDTDGGRR